VSKGATEEFGVGRMKWIVNFNDEDIHLAFQFPRRHYQSRRVRLRLSARDNMNYRHTYYREI
jgi:hypothetical protein